MNNLTGSVRFHTIGTGRGPFQVSDTHVSEPHEEVLRIEIDVKSITEQLSVVNDQVSLDPAEVRKEYFPFMEPVRLIDDLLKKHV